MTRRWLIRCLCLLPLTLCALGWVWSESHGELIRYVYHGTHLVGCGASAGRVWLVWGQCDDWSSYPGGLTCGSWRAGPADVQLLHGATAWLGFRFGYYKESSKEGRMVVASYVFPLLLSALLFILAWRTTRPRPWRGQGFPVELATRKEPP